MPSTPASDKTGPEAADLWEVAVALPLAQTLTYRRPPELAAAGVGSLVQAPVGRQTVTGYLLAPALQAPPVRLRSLKKLLDPIPRFGPEMVPLFRWLADYYQYPLGEALSRIIPGGARPCGGRQETWVAPVPPAAAPPLPRLGPRSRELLAHLQEAGAALPVSGLGPRFPGSLPVLRRLEKRGLVVLSRRPALQDPLESHPWIPDEALLPLAPEQELALTAIIRGIASGSFSPFLLRGHRQRQDRSLSGGRGPGPGPGASGPGAAAGDRPEPPGGPSLPAPLRASGHPAAQRPLRGRPPGPVAPHHAGRSGRGGGGPLRSLRPLAPPGPGGGGRGARLRLQAGRRPALPGPGRGPLPRQAGGGGRGAGLRHPPDHHLSPGPHRQISLSQPVPPGHPPGLAGDPPGRFAGPARRGTGREDHLPALAGGPGRGVIPGGAGPALLKPPGLCPGPILPVLRPRLPVPPVQRGHDPPS